jgi:hypothetical protein
LESIARVDKCARNEREKYADHKNNRAYQKHEREKRLTGSEITGAHEHASILSHPTQQFLRPRPHGPKPRGVGRPTADNTLGALEGLDRPFGERTEVAGRLARQIAIGDEDGLDRHDIRPRHTQGEGPCGGGRRPSGAGRSTRPRTPEHGIEHRSREGANDAHGRKGMGGLEFHDPCFGEESEVAGRQYGEIAFTPEDGLEFSHIAPRHAEREGSGKGWQGNG